MNMLTKNAARVHMLKSQILTGHVLDPRILSALDSVQREDFVPAHFKGSAYVDEEIPLANGRVLMDPLDFARLLQHADVMQDETVLDIGSGCGYSSAILSLLTRKVVAIEEDPALAQASAATLGNCPNVSFRQAPLVAGSPADAPYDAILIEGAIEYLPQALADQLREGGRIIAGEHNAKAKVGAAGLSTLIRFVKVRGKLYKTLIRDATTALLPAFRKPQVFTL